MALSAGQKDKLFFIVLEATNAQSHAAAMRTLFDAFFISQAAQKALLQTMIDGVKANRQTAISNQTLVTTGWTDEVTAIDAITANL